MQKNSTITSEMADTPHWYVWRAERLDGQPGERHLYPVDDADDGSTLAHAAFWLHDQADAFDGVAYAHEDGTVSYVLLDGSPLERVAVDVTLGLMNTD